MKKVLIPILPIAAILLMVLPAHTRREFHPAGKAADSMVVFTAEVKAILDKKCYGCHSNTSKGMKARKKLNWDSLNLISRVQKANRLDDIVEVLSEDEMPPKKFLEKEPGAKLTPEEKKLLENWADSELNRISRVTKKK